MSASLNVESDWNFRVSDKRLVVVKSKNEVARKVAVLDVLTNLMFATHIPDSVDMGQFVVEREYLFDLRVYTSKFVGEVDKEFVGFFEADIDQSMRILSRHTGFTLEKSSLNL